MSTMHAFRLKNDLAQLTRLHEEVTAFGRANDIKEAVLFEFNLALDELVTNIISYGFQDDVEHEIGLELHMQNDMIVAVIRDDGSHFDPNASAKPDTVCRIEDRCIGGLGIHLAKSLVESIDYQQVGGVNVMTLRKKNASRCRQDSGRDGSEA